MSAANEGNQVSLEHGNGVPDQTAAEMKPSKEPIIESKEGEDIPSEQPPVVHAGRDGANEVESKEEDAIENGNSKPTATPNEEETRQNGYASTAGEVLEDQGVESIAEEKDHPAAPAEETDKMDLTSEAMNIRTGEKRGREEDDTEEAQSEGQNAEKQNGKEAKKAKLDNGDATENGHTHRANKHDQYANGIIEVNGKERGSPNKIIKGPGCSTKVDGDAVVAEAEETIARRTRSKA